MIEVTGVVGAPLEDVVLLTLTVRPGPIGPDDSWLLFNVAPANGAILTGGPNRFTAAGTEHTVTVDVDANSWTIALQGGWWYRGEYAVDHHPGGTRFTHRVYNVATWTRWAVPLANRFFIGFEDTVRRGFEELLCRIGERLDCPAHLDDEPTSRREDRRSRFAAMRGARRG